MAKKRRKKSGQFQKKRRSSSRKQSVAIVRVNGGPPARRRRRRSGGGRRAGMGLMPNRDELYDMGAAAVFGVIERKAKTDQSFVLNTIVAKSPIPQLGFAGNVALAARLANRFAFKHPLLARFAKMTAVIAAYQIGRQGSLFTSVAPFTVAGDDDDAMGGDLDMGALAADADMHQIDGYDDEDEMSGLDDEIVDNVEMAE